MKHWYLRVNIDRAVFEEGASKDLWRDFETLAEGLITNTYPDHIIVTPNVVTSPKIRDRIVNNLRHAGYTNFIWFQE